MAGTVLVSLVPVLLGAALAVLPAYYVERRRERTALVTRWDTSLYTLCAEFTSAVRLLLYLAERTPAPKDSEIHYKEFDDAQIRLRALSEQIRLIGNLDVQRAARIVQHHSWSVREEALTGADPHEGDYSLPAKLRLRAALFEFYTAARTQLRVADPRGVVPDDIRQFGLVPHPTKPGRSSPSPR
jgi:hypothetical protein